MRNETKPNDILLWLSQSREGIRIKKEFQGADLDAFKRLKKELAIGLQNAQDYLNRCAQSQWEKIVERALENQDWEVFSVFFELIVDSESFGSQQLNHYNNCQSQVALWALNYALKHENVDVIALMHILKLRPLGEEYAVEDHRVHHQRMAQLYRLQDMGHLKAFIDEYNQQTNAQHKTPSSAKDILLFLQIPLLYSKRFAKDKDVFNILKATKGMYRLNSDGQYAKKLLATVVNEHLDHRQLIDALLSISPNELMTLDDSQLREIIKTPRVQENNLINNLKDKELEKTMIKAWLSLKGPAFERVDQLLKENKLQLGFSFDVINRLWADQWVSLYKKADFKALNTLIEHGLMPIASAKVSEPLIAGFNSFLLYLLEHQQIEWQEKEGQQLLMLAPVGQATMDYYHLIERLNPSIDQLLPWVQVKETLKNYPNQRAVWFKFLNELFEPMVRDFTHVWFAAQFKKVSLYELTNSLQLLNLQNAWLQIKNSQRASLMDLFNAFIKQSELNPKAYCQQWALMPVSSLKQFTDHKYINWDVMNKENPVWILGYFKEKKLSPQAFPEVLNLIKTIIDQNPMVITQTLDNKDIFDIIASALGYNSTPASFLAHDKHLLEVLRSEVQEKYLTKALREQNKKNVEAKKLPRL